MLTKAIHHHEVHRCNADASLYSLNSIINRVWRLAKATIRYLPETEKLKKKETEHCTGQVKRGR
jgi:hypothetical protein